MSAAPCLAEPQQYEVQFGRLRNFLTGKYQEARKRKVADFFVISVSKEQYNKILNRVSNSLLISTVEISVTTIRNI